MKNALLSLLCLASLAPWATATTPLPSGPARLDRGQVETLVSPIALYPDALVALILPASTRPSDIVLAARFLERGGNPAATSAHTWEESVKALAHYGEVIAYLDENLEWTQSLGDCFLIQPEDVMGAIQTLRARASEAGLLTNTDEHSIIFEEGEIRIVPARPTVIHVPRYNPEALHVTHIHTYRSSPGPFLSFGIGYGIGSWLAYDCDWRHRSVIVVHRPHGWYHRPDWRVRPTHHHPHHHAGIHWKHWTPPAHHHAHRTPRPAPAVIPRPHFRGEAHRPASAPRPHAHNSGRDSSRPTWNRSQNNPPRSQAAETPRNWRRDPSAPSGQNRLQTPPSQRRAAQTEAGPRQRNHAAATPAAPAPALRTSPAASRPGGDSTRGPRPHREHRAAGNESHRAPHRAEGTPRTFSPRREAAPPRTARTENNSNRTTDSGTQTHAN